MRRMTILSAALLAAVLPAQKETAAKAAKPETIVDLAVANGSFQTLVAAAKAAGLVDTLSGKGPFTVFAPTDDAFAALGEDAIAGLLKPENKARLQAILKYHVVAGARPAAEVATAHHLISLQGQRLMVETGEDGVTVAGARVLKTDLRGSNGVIHVIDRVIVPSEGVTVATNLVAAATSAGKFGTLLAAAKAAGLAETLAQGGPFTVFAPTDDAFAALGDATIADLLKPENKAKLQGILKYHVVAGDVLAAQAIGATEVETLGGETLPLQWDAESKTLKVGGAKVVATDVLAGNGVIHVIDAVLLPR